MRINKFIASAGYASRRKADELIQNGKVKVNGAVLKEPGYDVQPQDKVTVEGHTIECHNELVYYALNKPPGYVTTTNDEKGRPAVTDLMSDCTLRVYPVGRLDYETAGLLIMTNDGDFANKVAHPSGKIYKTYMAEINGPIAKEEVWALRKGVDIGGYITAPARVEVIKQNRAASLVKVEICEGRNRQVRKMFQAVGYKVTYLQRTAIGTLNLGRLKEGSYRKLTKQEIEYFKSL